MPKKERGLGRGLDALLSGTLEGDYETVRELPAEKIHPRKDQPRKNSMKIPCRNWPALFASMVYYSQCWSDPSKMAMKS